MPRPRKPIRASDEAGACLAWSMASPGSPRCPPRLAWQLTCLGPAPAPCSLAGCSSVIRSARPWRPPAAVSCVSGWAPTTWRLPPPGCWPGPRRGRPRPHHLAGAEAQVDGCLPPDAARGHAGGPGCAQGSPPMSPRRARTRVRDVPHQDAVPDAGRVGERRIPYA